MDERKTSGRSVSLADKKKCAKYVWNVGIHLFTELSVSLRSSWPPILFFLNYKLIMGDKLLLFTEMKLLVCKNRNVAYIQWSMLSAG